MFPQPQTRADYPMCTGCRRSAGRGSSARQTQADCRRAGRADTADWTRTARTARTTCRSTPVPVRSDSIRSGANLVAAQPARRARPGVSAGFQGHAATGQRSKGHAPIPNRTATQESADRQVMTASQELSARPARRLRRRAWTLNARRPAVPVSSTRPSGFPPRSVAAARTPRSRAPTAPREPTAPPARQRDRWMPCARGVDAWSASRLLTAPVLPGNWLDGSHVIGIAEVHTHAAYLTCGNQESGRPGRRS